MRIFVGLLAIFTIAFVFSTAFAVPRYSASVPQVGDSPNAVADQQVDGKMNNERGGIEKEITVDALGGAASGDRQGKAQSSDAQVIQNAGSDHDPLISPKYGLIPAANIREYPHTDTYLDLSDADVSHYFILKEDYVFQNLDGRSYNIPAGFIWDGASIAKWLGAVPGLLEVGNTRYNSALAEGLIHDYMYRNPQQFTKKESDDLFYENLKRNNNLNPKVMSAGVKIFGGRAYLGHAFNRISHEYWFDKLPDFYANNLRLYQRSIDTSKLESLLKEGIVFLKNLIAKGERATNSQIATHNQRVKEMIEELVKIAKQIESMNVSAEEKKRIGEKVHEKVDRLQSQFDSLCERAKSMGLVQEATTEQKREVFKDMQGKQTEVSRDAEKAKESSAKASASSQGRTMTEEDVFRMLREEGSGIKAASGRPNSTLR